MQSSVRMMTIALFLLGLAGCNTVASPDKNNNIRPAQTTNDVARSNLDLGIAYMKEGDYEKALDKLNKAKEADPNYSPTYNVLGLLYQLLGQNNKAEDNFKKAIRLNSADSSTLNNYGRLLCQEKRYEEAEDTFKQAADNPLYATPEIAIANAGVCVYDIGEIDKAESYFRKALSLNPRIPPALLLMSEISYNRNDALSARGYFKRYAEVARHTPKSLWLGIQIEQELGDADAVSSYALLLRNQFPESPEAEKLRQARIR